MGDREERHEERQKKRREERHERPRNQRRRVRDSPLNLQGEQHELPILPKGTLKTFSVMEQLILKDIWIYSWIFVIFILLNMMM
jgi:hypothetical protein